MQETSSEVVDVLNSRVCCLGSISLSTILKGRIWEPDIFPTIDINEWCLLVALIIGEFAVQEFYSRWCCQYFYSFRPLAALWQVKERVWDEASLKKLGGSNLQYQPNWPRNESCVRLEKRVTNVKRWLPWKSESPCLISIVVSHYKVCGEKFSAVWKIKNSSLRLSSIVFKNAIFDI